jgi:hypothetical protein
MAKIGPESRESGILSGTSVELHEMARETRKPHYRQAVNGYIYFIRCPSLGLVKCGFTTDHPDGRLERFRCISPAEIEPIAFFRGTVADEKAVHVRFAPLWSHAEWFRLDDAFEAYIAEVAEPWAAEDRGFQRPFPTVMPRPTKAEWAKLTYVRMDDRWQTVAEWMAETKCRSDLMLVKAALNRAISPEEIFRPGYGSVRVPGWGRPLDSVRLKRSATR